MAREYRRANAAAGLLDAEELPALETRREVVASTPEDICGGAAASALEVAKTDPKSEGSEQASKVCWVGRCVWVDCSQDVWARHSKR
jgi:hypothetical protein